MPKKKSLWARDCKCLVCETETVNYQCMAMSQTVELDDWLVPHLVPVGEYESFPPTLKTTICSSCLMASNEYNYGVEKYIYFTRNMARNGKVQEFYKSFIEERFQYLCEQFELFEEEAAKLDMERGKPEKMRSRATLEKVWKLGGDYPKQYIKLLFDAPRDLVTSLVACSMDRYCQMARIAYEYDLNPPQWDYKTVRDVVCAHYDENKLDLKMSEPRFYYTAINYMHSREQLLDLSKQLGKDESAYESLISEYFDESFRWMRYCYNNDDLSAIPLELKDGGINFVLARFYKEAGADDEATKEKLIFHLRGAHRYANNALKRIANTNQQRFVNAVDDMWKEYMGEDEK